MKKIRTGIVGVGFIGAAHIEALRRLGFVEIVAICNNVNGREIADQLCVTNAYSDYKEMIDKESLDVIHICTPNSTHFDIAKYAIEKGVNVMCEKPFTHSVQEAEILVKAAEEKGVVNAVNFHCRYYPMIRQMREMVKDNELGRILSINGGYFQDWLLQDTDYSWRLESAQSGESRAVADIGSHWIDSVEFTTGLKTKRVFADFATFHEKRKKPRKEVETFSNKLSSNLEYEEFKVDTEDFAQVIMEFDNGAKGNMIVSQMYAGRKNQMTISIAGSNQSLFFDSEQLNELWVGSRTDYNKSIVKDPALLKPQANNAVVYPGGHIEGFPDAVTNNFRAFYKAIIDKQESDFATFADGLREMRACCAIVESAKTSKWVTL